jgi:hypothetical protein
MKLRLLATTLVGLTSIASADVSLIDNDQTIAVDCAKDKNVSIIGNNATVTLTGTCARVSVSGNSATVTGAATTVQISGNRNTATLTAVDAIVVTGNKKTVTYKGTADAKLKKPKISNPGTANTITPQK